MQTHIDDDISRFSRNNRKTLFEVLAKTYNFFFERNSLVNIAEVRKGTADDHEISFSLHRDLVPKDQLGDFNKLGTIGIFFDRTDVFTLRVQKNLEFGMSSSIILQKRDCNV